MPSIIEGHADELMAGQMLGRYELLMPIAKGGMGSVWAARLKGTRGFRKLVAVKTILRNLENEKLQQMLFQEAVLASQIRHPNVAETLELGEHEGTMYLVMELVLGESLLFVLREAQAHGGIPFNVSINLVAQVCRGLAAAHDLRDESGQRIGLIHRDISPPNVLVTETGIVKIVDFGVATTTSNSTYGSGEIKGKLSYLAPEQLRGEPLDARVDVFATGILLYLLTVGRHPFRCASESSTIANILSPVPATPPSALIENYPEAVEQVVLRALDKDREKRFPNILALLEALEAASPAAFGPRADEAVAQLMQGLLKERLRERTSTMRIAEEWAETSSRHSRSSLPAVTASTPPQPSKKTRAALIGVGGVLTGLAVSAAAITAYLNVPVSAASSVAASMPREQARILMPAYRPELKHTPRAETTEAPAPERDEAPSVKPSRPAAAEARELTAEADPEAEDLAAGELVSAPTSEERSLPAAPLAPPLAPLLAVTPASSPIAAANVPPPVTATAKAALAGPRVVASKVGHRQLLTNPSSQAARIRVPQVLQRSGQTFGATVNLCVSGAGQVTKVSILRSAGPALDPQITRALSGWRYRPLVEDGKSTPFCYVLNYQLDAQ